MASETEIRALIDSPEPYEARLKDNDFTYVWKVFQEDRQFDTPDGELTKAWRKIRIRTEKSDKNTTAELTYKAPQSSQGATSIRTEENISISPESIDSYTQFFWSIGYPLLIYDLQREKNI